jgi:hypothetical protein
MKARFESVPTESPTSGDCRRKSLMSRRQSWRLKLKTEHSPAYLTDTSKENSIMNRKNCPARAGGKLTTNLKNKMCTKANIEVVGKLKIGDHTLNEKEFLLRVIDYIPPAQFASIVQKIKLQLNKEHSNET